MSRIVRLTFPLLVTALCVGTLPSVHAAPSAAPMKALVKVGKTDIGRILVNTKGFTLYYWEQEKPMRIKCTGGCAQAWPPLLVTKGTMAPHTVRGVKGAFGTVKRPDGKRQVTFKGRALYLYQGDEKPGDTKCQAKDDWYVIKATGELTGPSSRRGS